MQAIAQALNAFLSTLSLRRATCQWRRSVKLFRHFYPRSPCGERPNQCQVDQKSCSISIHALLAESDQLPTPKPPRVIRFLSTLSLRRATIAGRITSKGTKISIHALLAESDTDGLFFFNGRSSISIHALLAESDVQLGCRSSLNSIFLSTLSLRRATRRVNLFRFERVISIHALLAESDSKSAQNSGALLRI